MVRENEGEAEINRDEQQSVEVATGRVQLKS
jgi:hypothetical protein